MSDKTNDQVLDSIVDAIDENVERAAFLKRKVEERLEDLDLEGALDLISHYANLTGTFWEMFHRDLNGDEGDADDVEYAEDAARDKEKDLEKARI